jgi:hypothetical protein
MMTATIFEPARVWLRRGALDRRLARGADPSDSPQLARRAQQLKSRRCRHGLAQGIRNLLDAAEEPRRALTSAVPLQRRAILTESPLLIGIARELTSEDDLNPRGIALVEQLLTDGDSPLYGPAPEGALHEALIHARAAMHLV